MKNVAVSTVLCISDVNVSIGKANILKNISFTARSGSLMAVMGPTGSGKTSLLNVVAGKSHLSSGEITLSGVPFDKQLRRRLGFVLQQDAFFSSLSLWETLYFTAMIRLPESVSKQEKLARIDEIVDVLDIRHCLHTVVGDSMIRGLSGGEKKRTSIGCELLTDPDILLLDEPTSGLDSSMAFLLMCRIKEYTTKYNKIVVMTIHQPSSRIYHMFDSLMLLAKGQVAYLGAGQSEPLDYFSRLGHQCETNYNPADFLLEVITSEKPVLDKIMAAYDPKIEQMSATINSHNGLSEHKEDTIHTKSLAGATVTPGDLQININEDESTKRKWPTSFMTQFKMLTWRNFKQTRMRIVYVYSFISDIVLGIVLGLAFFQMSDSVTSSRDKMGMIYLIVTSFVIKTATETVMTFSLERTVISKERYTGAYRLSAYYLAKTLGELPLIVILPTLQWTIGYWVAGLSGASEFFASWAILVLGVFNSQGFGLLVGAIVMNVRLAIVIIMTWTLCSKMLSGFVSFSIPWWFEWAKYLSIIQYPVSAMSIVVFENMEDMTCNKTGMTTFSKCLLNSSDYVTSDDMLFEVGIELPVYFYVLVMLGLSLLTRCLSYLALRYLQRGSD